MKHGVPSAKIFAVALAAAGVLGLVGAAAAQPDSKGEKVQSEAVREQTIVKTDTLYSFPKSKPLEKAVPAETAPPPQKEGEYRIGPGDTLEFQLLDDTQMNREVKVR